MCSVTSTPAPIMTKDPRVLLYHWRDSIHNMVMDNKAMQKRGWRRMVQLSLVFFLSQINIRPLSRALLEAQQLDTESLSTRTLGKGVIPLSGSRYLLTWHDSNINVAKFNAFSRSGKSFCPPILTILILDREPERALEWIDCIVSRFDFTHVIPGHLDNDSKAD